MATTAKEMSWDDIKALVAELAIQSKETDKRLDEIEHLLKKCVEKTECRFQELHEQGGHPTEECAINPGEQVGYSSDPEERFKPKKKKIPKIRYSEEVTKKYTERLWQRAIDDGIIDHYDTDKSIDMLLEPELVALIKRLDGACRHFSFYRGGFSAHRDGEDLHLDFSLRSNHAVLTVAFRHVLDKEAVNQLLSKMSRIKRLVPTMADCAIYGVVAGMAIEDHATVAATEAGFWILGYSDKHKRWSCSTSHPLYLRFGRNQKPVPLEHS